MLSVYTGYTYLVESLSPLSYALALTLVRLLSFSLELVPSLLLEEILEALKAFIASVRTDKMAQSLEEYQCNWITLAPFVDIFFAPIQQRSKKVSSHEPGSTRESEVWSVCTQTSVMSLTVEMSRSCHRQLAIKQGLPECLVCLPWVVDDKWLGEVQSVLKMLIKDEDSHLPVPRLHSLAAITLSKVGQFSIRDTLKFY